MEQGEHFERKKALAVFLSIVMLAMIAGYCWMAYESIDQPLNIEQRQFYFSISMYGLPGLFALPVFLMMIYGALIKHFSTLPEKHFKLGVKLSLWLFGLVFLSRIVYGVVLPGYLKQHGYSYCKELTAPALQANDVWVKRVEYCHPLSYLVNGEVLDWLDEQQAAGAKPSTDEVTAHLEKLIAQFKASRGLD
jgi:hypothetical protein